MLSVMLKYSTYVSVRDEPSKKALEKFLNPDRVKMVPDTAFSLGRFIPQHAATEKARLIREQLGLKKPYVVIQATQNLERFTDHIRRFRDEQPDVSFLLLRLGPVLCDHESFIDRELPDTYSLPEWPSPMVLAALIAESEGVAGHSYHLAITALCAGVPVFTPSDLSIGKFTALSKFETVYPLSTLAVDDPLWLKNRLGRKMPLDLMAGAENELRQHWDHVADCVGVRHPQSIAAMNEFMMSLPFLLEGSHGE